MVRCLSFLYRKMLEREVKMGWEEREGGLGLAR